MRKTIDEMKLRLHNLEERDPVRNANIIRKIRREIKKAQTSANQEQ